MGPRFRVTLLGQGLPERSIQEFIDGFQKWSVVELYVRSAGELRFLLEGGPQGLGLAQGN